MTNSLCYKNSTDVAEFYCWAEANPTGFPGAVNGITFSEDGRYVVTSGRDNKIKVWDLATGEDTLVSYIDLGSVYWVYAVFLFFFSWVPEFVFSSHWSVWQESLERNLIFKI
jgi:WD40 repeat protein